MNDESDEDRRFMRRALALADEAESLGEVPVGAVLVRSGEIIGEGYNNPISSHDPSAHAEVRALRDAAYQVGNYRLPDSVLYVTLEPCAMCAGAMVHARVERLVFAAPDPRAGAAFSQMRLLEGDVLNHQVRWEQGLFGEEAAQKLRDFFRKRR